MTLNNYTMKSIFKFIALITILSGLNSCISKKELALKETDWNSKLSACEREVVRLQSEANSRQDQIADLKDQLSDAKSQRDKQLTQVGDLTVLSQSASDNIKETL